MQGSSESDRFCRLSRTALISGVRKPPGPEDLAAATMSGRAAVP